MKAKPQSGRRRSSSNVCSRQLGAPDRGKPGGSEPKQNHLSAGLVPAEEQLAGTIPPPLPTARDGPLTLLSWDA